MMKILCVPLFFGHDKEGRCPKRGVLGVKCKRTNTPDYKERYKKC